METRATYITKKKMTAKEYFSSTPEGNFELINGVVNDPPSPYPDHQRSSGNIQMKLRNFVSKKKLGEVFDAPLDVVIDEKNVLQPDILFISKGKKHFITQKNIQGPPDLVIEIVSKSSKRHDTVKKKALYEKFGIKEYWLVYQEEKKIEMFILKNGKYFLYKTAFQEDKIKSLIVKGFVIKVNDIFQ